jgi:hypothetical protein
LPEVVLSSLILMPGESVSAGWKACYELPKSALPTRSGFVEVNFPSSVDGFLVLTDRRMVFIASKGLMVTRQEVALSIDYEDILGVECVSGISHKLRISHKWSATPAVFHTFMDGSASAVNLMTSGDAIIPPESIKENLVLRIRDRLMEIEEERKREKTQLILDFSFLKSILEKGGVVMQSMRCPSCGANLQMPKSGTTVKCDYCGTSVNAIDIFERLRKLLANIDSGEARK